MKFPGLRQFHGAVTLRLARCVCACGTVRYKLRVPGYDAASLLPGYSVPKKSIKEKSLLLVWGRDFFVGTYMVWVEKTGSSSHSTGCPAARVLGISSKRWLALPRNRRLMSY